MTRLEGRAGCVGRHLLGSGVQCADPPPSWSVSLSTLFLVRESPLSGWDTEVWSPRNLTGEVPVTWGTGSGGKSQFPWDEFSSPTFFLPRPSPGSRRNSHGQSPMTYPAQIRFSSPLQKPRASSWSFSCRFKTIIMGPQVFRQRSVSVKAEVTCHLIFATSSWCK